MTFPCHQAGLRGLPHRLPPSDSGVILALPLSAWLSFRALSPRWVSPPLMGFVRLHPSTVQHFRCPLPEPEGSFGQDLPQSWSCSVFVVSHHLDGLLHLGAAGLLHPATGHEVRRVSSSLRQPTRRWPALCAPFPRRGSHPSKNSTRQQPYRVTAACCPLVVTALFAAASSRAGCPALSLARVDRPHVPP
jgi:hypothetical protein